jgi:hypothetical protein
MDDEPVEYTYIPSKWYVGLGTFATIFYVALFWRFPALWGVLTASLLVLGSGFFTAKIVLGVKEAVPFWTVTLVTGLGWLLFLWLVISINQWMA